MYPQLLQAMLHWLANSHLRAPPCRRFTDCNMKTRKQNMHILIYVSRQARKVAFIHATKAVMKLQYLTFPSD